MHLSACLERRRNHHDRLHGDGASQSRANRRVGFACEKSLSRADAERHLFKTSKIVEATETKITLDKLSIGSRLLVRSRKDWRHAAVSKIADERVVLTVCSPTGRTYRLRREFDSEVVVRDTIPILTNDEPDDWRENFSRYDVRW